MIVNAPPAPEPFPAPPRKLNAPPAPLPPELAPPTAVIAFAIFPDADAPRILRSAFGDVEPIPIFAAK